LQGNAGAQSGFFETSSPSNYPSGATNWWHLIDCRHSNNSNNYALQIAGSFYDQNLYFRKTNNSSTQSWSQIMTSNNISGTTNYVAKFTSANAIGNSQIYDNGNVGIGTTSPAEKLDVTGNIKTTSLAGTGNRPVYADANGVLKTSNTTNSGPTSPVQTSYPSLSFSNTSSVSIPDNSCTGGTSNISVSGAPTAVSSSSISVCINIAHTWDADLEIFLVAPSGQILGLSNRRGGSSDNFINTLFADYASTNISSGSAPFTGLYVPETSTFAGCITSTITSFGSFGSGGTIDPNGTWSLKVFDRSGSDVGTITSWSIVIPNANSSSSVTQRIIAGSVNNNGTVVSGSGFYVLKVGNGLYEIIFTKPFSVIPSGSVAQVYPNTGSNYITDYGNGGSTQDNAIITGMANSKVRIKTGDGSGNASDRSFTFIFVGVD